MKKVSFWAILGVLSVLIVPSTSVFAAIDASSLGFGEAISNAMNGVGATFSLNCTVEATNKLVGLTQNEVTYKLKYSSNYSKLNATYNIQAASPDTFLHQKGGAFSLVKGNNYVPLTAANSIENKFTYDIADNPSVTIQANIQGVKCVTKTLQTIKPASAQINASALGTTGVNTNLNGANLKPATTTFNMPLVLPQDHTCQVLAEGAKLDSNSLQIGAGVKFDNLAKGKFNYSVRGFLSNDPAKVKEYTGVYTNGTAGGSGIILDANKKGFLFTFDAKTPNDKYVVSASIGNIDCKLVYFASPIVLQNGVQINQNPSILGNNGSVSGNAEGSVVAPEAGFDSEDQAEVDQLDLVGKDDAAPVLSDDIKDAKRITTTEDRGDQLSESRNSDYIVYGLLGAILLSLITYIVLKYRGMI